LQINKGNLQNAIIAGDFNSNVIWDQWDRWWNHSDVVLELEEIGIQSLYHKNSSELQGSETQPTFFLHRNVLKPYHIDYCFAATYFLEKLSSIEVGSFEDWNHLSDHTPIIAAFDRI
jgi:endonuclease/exonuclease/phosphatase family metal-dependent hydrolase